jgi:hypothetical protein
VPMKPYRVVCYRSPCQHEAKYKIASRWSNGHSEEFKTYGLACADCLRPLLLSALKRRSLCRLHPDEIQEAPQIFSLASRSNHQFTQVETKLTRDLTATCNTELGIETPSAT